jgi:DNA-binding beta-propeller fold protein YncE
MKTRICWVAVALLTAVTLYAQVPLVPTPPDQLSPAQLRLKAKADNAPDIPYEAVPDFFKMPPNTYMGEAIGVAENSKGHIFIQTCTERTRVFEFDPKGNYVREIGKDLYGNVYCHGLRIDSEDNIWVVDEGSNTIIKFNPEGRVTMVLGRRPEYPVNGLDPAIRAQDPAPPYIFNRQTDVAIDAAGNIFVADGYVNARVVKYDKYGHFIKQVGHRGSGPGEFNLPHAVVVDAKGNVYVGSRSDQRILVFDNDLNYKTEFNHVGAPWGLCITSGPHQYLYSSNANPDSQQTPLHEVTGQIYKMELDGTVLGKFGVPGKQPGQFGTAHTIDCRNENVIFDGEIVTWRAQKLILHPSASQGGKK